MLKHKFEITEYDVEADVGGPVLRIAFLSDFHVGPATPQKAIDSALAACLAQRPDVVLLGGDFISSTSDLAYLPALAESFGALRVPHGVYYVLGNHDYWSGPEKVRAAFDTVGLVDVTNRNTLLVEGIHLCGLDDSWEGQPDVPAAFAGAETGRRIVLAHNPKIFRKICDRDCVAICGHTHGGQIRIPLLPNPALLTGKYPYIKGWYQHGNSRLYVNRGLGTSILPFRVNCPPEITILKVPRDSVVQ